MKIVVIGGTGLIGSRLVNLLRDRGHEVLAASPNSGVNTVTGEGLATALAGASAVVDVSNSPTFEDAAALRFFETSTRNLLSAEAAAGVRHHVALSIVGADRLPDSGYLRAKVAQERIIKSSGMPYTILRSTQFFEFIPRIVDDATQDNTVRLPKAYIQPVVADDVVSTLADIVTDEPRNTTLEVAGPQKFRFDDLVRVVLERKEDMRVVSGDEHARYYGAELADDSLIPGDHPHLGMTRLETWLSASLDYSRH